MTNETCINKEAQKHLNIVARSPHFLADWREQNGDSNLESQAWLCQFIAKDESLTDTEHVKSELKRMAFKQKRRKEATNV